MKKVTVLGGSGFIGTEVCKLLVKKKYKVTILDLKKNKEISTSCKFIKGSILELNKLNSSIKGSDYVYNFAALADLNEAINKPLDTAMINIIGTINALKISKKNKVKKFIQASSIYAMSEEGGFYGASKRAAEDYIEKYHMKHRLKYTILRFGSLYGKNADSNNGIKKILRNALKKKTLFYRGKSNASRKYIHVQDAAAACVKSTDMKYDNKYLNITGGKTIKISNVMKIISKILNMDNKKILYSGKTDEGHYVNEPKYFKPRKGINLKLSKYTNFKKSLKELIKMESYK